MKQGRQDRKEDVREGGKEEEREGRNSRSFLYFKDPKNSTPKPLDTISSYSKMAGYKINLQKSLAFLYTNNEQTEKEYMVTIPFTIA
jgi:hypothetical protein